MGRIATSMLLALLVGAAVTCANDGAGGSCTPGQQVSCACPSGGMGGVQVCEPDGDGFGFCVGCEDGEGTTAGVVTGGGDGTTSATQTGSGGVVSDGGEGTSATGGAATGVGEETGVPGETGVATTETGVPGETGDAAFAWVWVDHGGPGFQPSPCAALAGVVDGKLVDPQAFFAALVDGKDPDDWVAVLNAIEPDLWACGVGQQRDSGGNVRGRLFLPTAACPDASPPLDDPMAVKLGVRQEEPCWAQFVDVVGEL